MILLSTLKGNNYCKAYIFRIKVGNVQMIYCRWLKTMERHWWHIIYFSFRKYVESRHMTFCVLHILQVLLVCFFSILLSWTCINSISLEFPVLQNKETYGIGYNCIDKCDAALVCPPYRKEHVVQVAWFYISTNQY